MADPTIADVAKSIADTQTALNIVWTILAGTLVMFMQAGFALVETGLTLRRTWPTPWA
jgi:Amt family ammonium transporter